MFYVLTAVEVFLQLYLEISLFLQIEGGCRDGKKWRRWLGILLLGVMAFLAFYNNLGCVVSNLAILVSFGLLGIWLKLWTDKKLVLILAWSFFAECLLLFLKMSVVIILGIYRKGSLGDINNNPDWRGSFLKIVMLMCLLFICQKFKEIIKGVFRDFLKRKKLTLFIVGGVEWIFATYLMIISENSFYSWAFVMNLLMMTVLVFGLLILGLSIQYISISKEKKMYLSREKLLKADYKLLKQEYEKNSKIMHDRKYELSYLQQCLIKEENEKALSYLEECKEKEHHKWKMEVWTGYGTIDFLINMGRERANEKNILFQVNIDANGIPIEEYDFFAIIGNLLDNALEAAEKCEKGKRYISLEMRTMNRMFMMTLKNSYAVEPIQKREKFISSKEGNGEHGWGIENVKSIVEKKEGYLKLEYSNYSFIAYVIFGV